MTDLKPLSREDQDKLAVAVLAASRQVDQLFSAIDRSLSYYFALHEEKFTRFNELKHLLQFSATGKATSIPDTYGIILETTEFDSAEALQIRTLFRQLAKVTHPDHNGSECLFKIVHTAYKAKDLSLIRALYDAIFNKTSLSDATRIINTRLQAVISQTRARLPYKLLSKDYYNGRNGCVDAAKDFAEVMLDTYIETLQIILLNGDKNGTSDLRSEDSI